MALAEHHGRIDAHQAAGLAFLFLQGLPGFFQLLQHQARMMPEQAPGFRGADRTGMPIQQLLAQGLFHQLDLPGDGRGRQAFAACDFREAAVVQHRDKQA